MSVEYRLIPGHPDYRVGSDGTVWSRLALVPLGKGGGTRTVSTDQWLRIATTVRKDRHIGVRLNYPTRRNAKVHRLVLEAFVGPCPPGMVCCHNDGNPANNRLENLRWDTRKANAEDAAKHGHLAIGERCGLDG